MRKHNRKLRVKRGALTAELGHAVRNDKQFQLAANPFLAGYVREPNQMYSKKTMSIWARVKGLFINENP
jgi:hypothetical protein